MPKYPKIKVIRTPSEIDNPRASYPRVLSALNSTTDVDDRDVKHFINRYMRLPNTTTPKMINDFYAEYVTMQTSRREDNDAGRQTIPSV